MNYRLKQYFSPVFTKKKLVILKIALYKIHILPIGRTYSIIVISLKNNISLTFILHKRNLSIIFAQILDIYNKKHK